MDGKYSIIFVNLVTDIASVIFTKLFYSYEWIFSYDMVHFGHANACRQAKLMGTHLIFGVHSDGLYLISKINISF